MQGLGLAGPTVTSRCRLSPGQRNAKAFAASLIKPALAGVLGASAAGCQNWDGTQPPHPDDFINTLFGVVTLSACDAWAVAP
jgi:hypothetical protein